MKRALGWLLIGAFLLPSGSTLQQFSSSHSADRCLHHGTARCKCRFVPVPLADRQPSCHSTAKPGLQLHSNCSCKQHDPLQLQPKPAILPEELRIASLADFASSIDTAVHFHNADLKVPKPPPRLDSCGRPNLPFRTSMA